MESKKDKMLAIMKRYIEVWRGWKRIWKVLLLLGIIAVVVVSVFFSIPSPYADAWDDLLLLYPEQFPGPGTTGTDIYGSGRTVTFLARTELIPKDIPFDKYCDAVGIQGYSRGLIGKAREWGECNLIADVEILNYIDVAYVHPSAYYETPVIEMRCQMVCKIHQIFAKDNSVEHQERDIVTIELPYSSKQSIAPYPELGIGQHWLFTLEHAAESIYAIPYGGYGIYAETEVEKTTGRMTDYMVTTPTIFSFSVPIRRDWLGRLYVDTYSMELLLGNLKDSSEYPWELIDKKKHRITDMDALGEYMQRAMIAWDEWYDAQNFPIPR